MKKKEIKKDIIRETLISSVQYLSENTYIIWSSLIGISLIISIVTFISGRNNNNMLFDNNLLGEALINEIYNTTSDDSLRLNQFNILLDNSNTKEGYNTAFINILNKYFIDNDLSTVKSMLQDNSFSSSDDMLNAYVYKMKADVLYNDDVTNAISYNKKAIDLVPSYDLKVSYSADLIDLLTDNNNINGAVKYLDDLKSLLSDINLSISTKNNLDFLEFKLKQLLKK